MRKKMIAALLTGTMVLSILAGCGGSNAPKEEKAQETKKTEAGTEAASKETVYPSGTITIYGTGQPQYLQEYFDAWLERHKDIAPDVKISIVQTEGHAKSREKITMTALSGAVDDLPDATYLDPVNIMELSQGGLLKDETDFLQPYLKDLVDGAANDATVNGHTYGLPESVRPNVLFYNKEIFDKYGIDPAMMSTFDGYMEAGKLLKEKSNGTVYLSYISPGSKTWRYWGRRGLMPQANAKIWDESGNVVIGQDEGTKLALGTLDTMYQQGLLLKSEIMEPALYDAINNGQVATFYIGAFWDEFLRKNCQATSGKWRVMASPEFESVGKAGAPVSSYFCIVNKGDNVYAGLLEQLWHDFQFDAESRNTWVKSMEKQNAPYANPISLKLLQDDFWKAPSDYYGGQSFREMEGKCLENGAANLVITPQDAEADEIISAELETYVAGNQTMEQAIANMDKNLKAKIGQAKIMK
ncbi:ABC transporter substrate-binding protein [Lacrimispora sp. AGF001]|uniref:ABC transporter substrate-binding protein n=1 Tax=Lacrimispora sp. AGF001 TaxID=3401631 RepID=UPI003B43B130